MSIPMFWHAAVQKQRFRVISTPSSGQKMRKHVFFGHFVFFGVHRGGPDRSDIARGHCIMYVKGPRKVSFGSVVFTPGGYILPNILLSQIIRQVDSQIVKYLDSQIVRELDSQVVRQLNSQRVRQLDSQIFRHLDSTFRQLDTQLDSQIVYSQIVS